MRRTFMLMVVGLGMMAVMALAASPALALSFSGNYYTLSSTHPDTLGGIDGSTVSGLVNAALSGTPGTVGAAPVYSGFVPPASGVITDTAPAGGSSTNEPIQWWTVHANVAADNTVNPPLSNVRSDAVTGGVLGGGAFANSFYSGAAGCGGTNNSCGYRAVHWIGTFSVVGGPVTLSLTGDDDAWLFLNGSLFLDNGGVKATTVATTTTNTLGIGTYTLDLFFADRHVVQSGITFSCQDAPGDGVGACLDPIPEPATLLLFGTTLAGLGAVVRRRMKGRSNIDA